MSLYKFLNGDLVALNRTTYSSEGILERSGLQAALKKNISVIAPDCLVVSEEFSDWQGSRRSIDLLAIDKEANLVVIELKRDEVGAHMELQALRYASMISSMTFEKVCSCFQEFLNKHHEAKDAREVILDFIDLPEEQLDDFGQDVRIILGSSNFSKELTTSVLWLRDKGIDITCVRLSPYQHKNDILINTEQIIPLPEAQDYLVRFREKNEEKKAVQRAGRDYSKYEFKGQLYNKRNLALELMKSWVELVEPKSLEDILKAFPKDVHRLIAADVDKIPESRIERFHIKAEDIIQLDSGEKVVISNQWRLSSISALVEKISSYGIKAKKSE